MIRSELLCDAAAALQTYSTITTLEQLQTQQREYLSLMEKINAYFANIPNTYKQPVVYIGDMGATASMIAAAIQRPIIEILCTGDLQQILIPNAYFGKSHLGKKPRLPKPYYLAENRKHKY